MDVFRQGEGGTRGGSGQERGGIGHGSTSQILTLVPCLNSFTWAAWICTIQKRPDSEYYMLGPRNRKESPFKLSRCFWLATVGKRMLDQTDLQSHSARFFLCSNLRLHQGYRSIPSTKLALTVEGQCLTSRAIVVETTEDVALHTIAERQHALTLFIFFSSANPGLLTCSLQLWQNEGMRFWGRQLGAGSSKSLQQQDWWGLLLKIIKHIYRFSTKSRNTQQNKSTNGCLCSKGSQFHLLNTRLRPIQLAHDV